MAAALAALLLVALPAAGVEIPWAATAVVASDADAARAVEVADLDGDGDLDLISASFNDDTIAWYEKDSSQSFTKRTVSTVADGARSVAVGDLDGDGDLDLVSASQNDDTIAWYENQGGAPPTFNPRVITEDPDVPFVGDDGPANGASSVAVADIDRDGDLDIVFSASLADLVAWYENDGTPADDGNSANDWALRAISLTPDGPQSVFPADVNGDGWPDVVSGSFNDDTIRWYENDKTPADLGWGSHTVSTAPDGPRSVHAADMDGDGDVDLLAASEIDDRLRVFQNLGALGFLAYEVPVTVDGAGSVRAVDLDRDGDMDILAASFNDDTVRWFENVGFPSAAEPFTERPVTSAAAGARQAVAADVDGDGDLDVVASSDFDDTVAWHENLTIHRSAHFPEQSIISTAADFALSVFAADVDGDGDVDALSASFSDGKIAWYENLGPDDGSGPCAPTATSACFGGQQVITTAAVDASSVFAADVDGDGDVDALSASSREDKIAWYENQGPDNGTLCSVPTSACFGAQQVITTAADNADSVFAADVDGDGDLDALSASMSDHKIAWYENLGPDDGTLCGAPTSACFGAPQVITTAAGDARSVFAADVDGDGDVDALSASSLDSKIAWYENLGPDDGTLCGAPTSACFGAQQVITTAADLAWSVFAADVDGDGDLDALSASFSDDGIAWYENLGPDDGTLCGAPTSACFGAPQVMTAAAGFSWGVFPVDVDGDGDLDALSALPGDNTVSWFENLGPGDGSGPCAPMATSACFGAQQVIAAAVLIPSSVFAADVDGDGDPDVLSSSRDDDTIAWYENRGGQFALPTTETAQRVISGGQSEDVFAIEVAHRGREGDGDLELLAIDLRFETAEGVPLTDAQLGALIDGYELHADDGSGVFELGADLLVPSLKPPQDPNSGRRVLVFFDDNPQVQVPWGPAKTFFLAVTPTADAASQSPNSFRVRHQTETTSTARDRDYNIPLSLEYLADVGTGSIATLLNDFSCQAPFDLNLAPTDVDFALKCQAGTTLRAGDAFRVLAAGSAWFLAGEGIELGNGFEVRSGGELQLELGGGGD